MDDTVTQITNWTLAKELPAYLYGVCVGSNGVTFAVGQSDTTATIKPLTIYKSIYNSSSNSNNGLGGYSGWGKAADLPYTSISAQLQDVSTRDGVRAIAVGSGGIILYTNNSGASWHQPSASGATLCSGATLYSVSLAADLSPIAVAAGNAGCVLKSSDYGTSWTRLSSTYFGTQTFRFKSVYAVQWDIIYVTGSSGQILRTTNVAQDWEIDYSQSSNKAFYSITMHDFVSYIVLGYLLLIFSPCLP